MKKKLNKNLTPEEFKTSYFYVKDLKLFAKELGIQNIPKLRKGELEGIILHYLETGEIKKISIKKIPKKGIKDSEIGLSLDMPVKNFTNDKKTWQFLLNEADKKFPGIKKKSGTTYWLNQWLEEQFQRGANITYENIVDYFCELCNRPGKLPRIAITRFNNFVSDFLENEKNATRKQALDEWEKLKNLDVPKDYENWKKIVKE